MKRLTFEEFRSPYYDEYDSASKTQIRKEYREYLKRSDDDLNLAKEIILKRMGQKCFIKKGRGYAEMIVKWGQLTPGDKIIDGYDYDIAPYQIMLEYTSFNQDKNNHDNKYIFISDPKKLIFDKESYNIEK